MRKLFILALTFSFIFSFCQEKSQEDIHKEIRFLKESVPSLKGTAKVDALNRLAYSYFSLWINWKLEADSAYLFAMQAYNEAKKIGYKKGLGYSYLRLGTADDLKVGFDIQVNKKFDSSLLLSAEQYARKAIAVGEQINNDALIAAGYSMLTGCAYDWVGYEDKPDYSEYLNLCEKAISFYKKVKKEDGYQGLYRDLNKSGCENCIGTETAIGKLYETYAVFGNRIKDISTLEDYQKKAIDYFSRANDTRSVANGYVRLSSIDGLRYGGPFLYREEAEASLKKAVSLYREINDEEGELTALSSLCGKYFNTGDFENGLEYGKRMISLSDRLRKNQPSEDFEWGLFWMSAFYQYAGDYSTALNLLYRLNPNYPNQVPKEIRSGSIGELHRLMGNYDSAMYYLAPFSDAKILYGPAKAFLGSLYIDLKQYDKGIQFIKQCIESESKKGLTGAVARASNEAARAYYLKGDYNSALQYARQASAMLKSINMKVYLIDNYKMQTDIFNKLRNNDSAFYYLNLYTGLKDSLLSRQFLWKLNTLRKEAEDEKRTGQIKLLQKENLIKQQQLQQQLLLQQQNETQLVLLNKDNKIKNQQIVLKDQSLKEQRFLRQQKESDLALLDKENKLKDQQLKQQTFLRNALVAGLFLLLILSFVVVRVISLRIKNERLLNEKKQEELQRKSSELEMQALRAQMNPHFIFNCLSSINKFILKNEIQAASDYLTRFSRLIRRVLTNSQLSMIPLSDEIEMLKLYLDMERLRFDDAFDYNIVYANTIEPETIYIPPMLLQPYCENAIWHGLMHKEGRGKLEIEMRIKNGELHCIITDNGIGRLKASELKSRMGERQKSYGLKITMERLALFNNQHSESYFHTDDVLDAQGNIAGTKVSLVIKYKDAIHELINS